MPNKKLSVLILLIVLLNLVGTGFLSYQFLKLTDRVDVLENEHKEIDNTSTVSDAPNESGSDTSDQTPIVTYTIFLGRPTDSDPTIIEPVERSTKGENVDVIKTSLEDYFKGPTALEEQAGLVGWKDEYFLSESNCGGADFSYTMENNIFTLKFCRETKSFEGVSIAPIKISLERTIGSISNAVKVIILDQNGNCWNDLSGINACMN